MKLFNYVTKEDVVDKLSEQKTQLEKRENKDEWTVSEILRLKNTLKTGDFYKMSIHMLDILDLDIRIYERRIEESTYRMCSSEDEMRHRIMMRGYESMKELKAKTKNTIQELERIMMLDSAGYDVNHYII